MTALFIVCRILYNFVAIRNLSLYEKAKDVTQQIHFRLFKVGGLRASLAIIAMHFAALPENRITKVYCLFECSAKPD